MTGSAILLFGPPAAGKSSLARDLLTRYRAFSAEPAMLYLGTDPLRETISGKTYLPSARTVVYDGVLALLCSGLGQGHHVLIDGNYLEPQHRQRLIEKVQQSQARLLTVLVSCRLEVGLRRNASRMPSERVPEDYLKEVYGRLDAARQTADLDFDSEENLAGRETEILTWLLGAPPPNPGPSTEEWAQQGERRTLRAGEAVWKAGHPCTEVIMLAEGELEVVREADGQPSVVINRLSPGALAGDLSSLDGSPHSATVRATMPSTIVSLRAAHFRTLLRREPDLLDRVLEGMAGRIRSLSGRAGTASVDLLTGLGNRRMLEDLWPHLAASAHRDGSSLSLALFDVDRFKGINDTFGHHVGDVVLKEMSGLLRDAIPEPGIPLRYGGDEFVVFLPGRDSTQAQALMESFAEKVRNTPLAVDEGVGLRATVSVGVASYPNPVKTTDELFAKADEAAYISKGDGRDRVTIYNV